MISYNDLYEILRKEKFSENLQSLPKSFVSDFSSYLEENKEQPSSSGNLFLDNIAKSKKQLENSIAIFKELMLRRKKKLLNLVFVAAETGIMKRDYENMLNFEKEMFDKFVKAFEEGDKELTKIFHGESGTGLKDSNRMVIFNQNVEQFVDMSGISVGPFAAGELANLSNEVSAILVSGGKAKFVDED